jgi:hypothetical protein
MLPGISWPLPMTRCSSEKASTWQEVELEFSKIAIPRDGMEHVQWHFISDDNTRGYPVFYVALCQCANMHAHCWKVRSGGFGDLPCRQLGTLLSCLRAAPRFRKRSSAGRRGSEARADWWASSNRPHARTIRDGSKENILVSRMDTSARSSATSKFACFVLAMQI